MRSDTALHRPRRFLRGLALPFALALCFGTVGCNGFSRFYRPDIDVKVEGDRVIALEKGQEPRLIVSSDPVTDVRKLYADGYVRIGSSSFTGPARGKGQILAQAKKVGATTVVYSKDYERTVTGSLGASSSTTYTSGYSSGGSVSATSTTYGTDPVPYSIARYKQSAWFLAKSKERPRIGVWVRELTEADRMSSGRNKGAAIDLVLNDSPAFECNLVPGDILVEVDGAVVTNSAEALQAMSSIPAERAQCEFKILRNGEERTVAVSGL